MASSNILNTRTTNYLELVANGRIYRVPTYQRDYSWEAEQWEDLWNDILELRGRIEDRHYMGALVVEGKGDREFLIIDGQQRLATLTLLALAVIAKLRALADSDMEPQANRERAEVLRSRFVGEKDPASLVESSKLFLNETDDAFYQDYLVQLRHPLNPRGLPKSSRLLWDCFRYYQDCLDSLPESARIGSALAELISQIVARQLVFILITVENEINAYTVFETLKARGLELTTTDLLKNYLFSRIQVSSDLRALQRRWRSLVTTVRQEHFPEFLRYHLLCIHPKIRSQRLFKLLRDQTKTPAEVFQLLDALEGRAELFAALSDSSHGYWSEWPDARPYVHEINLFRVRQMTPLLFAAWEKLSKDDFIRVLKLVSVVSFRYSVISRLNSNELEPVYHEAAKAILTGAATTPAHVFDRLQAIYVDDSKFRQDFSLLELDTTGPRKKLVKYMLARLERDTAARACDPDTDPATIEHILPENPLEDWAESFAREHWESSTYRLGNLTLLEPSANRLVGNSPYAEKVQAYSKSGYQITRQIVDLAPEQWNPALLNKRQCDLADRAVHIWRSDFV